MTTSRAVRGAPGPGRARADSPVSSGTGRMRTRGHDRAVEVVRTMIAGRVPHAIVISGPSGIGKTTLALDLAAGLLCDDPDPAARPCRACRGCRLVDRDRHPDVHRLGPSGPGDQIRIGRREAPEDGTVRRLATDLVLLPVEGGARVAIIERADRLTDDAQTALLKTLEEPPAGVTIVLCADDEDRLMPTVRSRAARIRLGPVATRDVESILTEAGVADPPLAARLARIAGGRPGAARALARAPAALAARDEVARILLDLLGASDSTRLAAARELTARTTDMVKALDRAALDEQRTETPDGAAGTGRGRGKKGAAPGPSIAPSVAEPASEPANGDVEAEADEASEPGAGRTAVPAAERRRAALIVVGLWRELARDLLIAVLGEERQIRDPELLDDLRVAATAMGQAATTELGEFLGRLDAAGELLEANVRPELVLDSLLLHWPRSAAR